MTIMRRRIQKTGGSSLIATLPKKWVEQCQLKEKDYVVVSPQHSGSLLIQPAKQVEQSQRIPLDIDDKRSDVIEREIFSRYIIGADEILIRGQGISPTTRNHIRHVAQRLLGMEIIDESATEILIKNIFDFTTLSPAETIDKIFHITIAMFEDSLRALRSDDEKLANDVITRDSEVDKLQAVITRQFHSLLRGRLNEQELQVSITTLNYYDKVSVQIERIADHAAKIAKAILLATRPPKKILSSQLVVETTNTLLEMLTKTAQIVRTNDNNAAHAILNTNHSLENKITQIREATQHATYRGTIMEIGLDRLRSYIMNIAEMTIDHSLEQSITTFPVKD